MSFRACMLVKLNLLANQLEEQCYNPNFKTAKKGSNNIVDFEVIIITQNKLNSQFLEYGDLLLTN